MTAALRILSVLCGLASLALMVAFWLLMAYADPGNGPMMGGGW